MKFAGFITSRTRRECFQSSFYAKLPGKKSSPIGGLPVEAALNICEIPEISEERLRALVNKKNRPETGQTPSPPQ